MAAASLLAACGDRRVGVHHAEAVLRVHPAAHAVADPLDVRGVVPAGRLGLEAGRGPLETRICSNPLICVESALFFR